MGGTGFLQRGQQLVPYVFQSELGGGSKDACMVRLVDPGIPGIGHDGPPRSLADAPVQPKGGIPERKDRLGEGHGPGQVRRWNSVAVAWSRGRTTISSTFTWEGRVTAHTMQSATSSAESGVSPSYTLRARSASPPNRTTLNSVPPTRPGLISVTRMGLPSSSSRSVLVSTRSACLAAV